METQTMQQLETTKRELRSQLDTRKDIDKVIEKLKENEQQIKALRTLELLKNVNREQAEKRQAALQIWECEELTEDITTADGSPHKVKAKKYPKLAAIPYVRIKMEEGHAIEISTGRERFRMYSTKYEYNKPTEYTRPETFADFLELNSIQPEDITPEKFAEFTAKLNAANEQMKQAIAQYDKTRKSLDVYQMQHIGLVNQQNEHFYFYEAK